MPLKKKAPQPLLILHPRQLDEAVTAENHAETKDSSSNPAPVRQQNPNATDTVILCTRPSRDGHGVVRIGYGDDDGDAYISNSYISGDLDCSRATWFLDQLANPKRGERYWGLLQIDTINGYVGQRLVKTRSSKI